MIRDEELATATSARSFTALGYKGQAEPLNMEAPANGIAALVAEFTLAVPAVRPPIDWRFRSK